jgi:hypothetical protein
MGLGSAAAGLAPTGGLAGAPAAGPPPAAPAPGGHGIIDKAMGVIGDLGTGVENGVGNYAKALKGGDKATWLSLLSGLGAMGTAPTRSLGVALASGAKAGADTYMGAQTAEANRQKTIADIAKTEAETRTQNVATLSKLRDMAPAGMMPVVDSTGQSQYVVNGQHWKYVPITQGSGPPGAANVDRHYSYLDQAGGSKAVSSAQNYVILPEQAKAASQAQITDTRARANVAHDNLLDIGQWADALSANKEGPLQGGPLQGKLLSLANTWNNAIKIAPIPEQLKQNMLVDDKGADEAVIAQKMSIARSLAQTGQIGQHAFSALEQSMAATASGHMPRKAALEIAAEQMVKNQREMDRAAYYNEFNKEVVANGGMDGSFNAQDAEDGFNNRWNQRVYKTDQQKMLKYLNDGSYSRIRNILSSQAVDPESIAAHKMLTDKLQKEGTLRYFTGASING